VLDLSTHPISQRWPTTHPTVLQLYSFPTSNGVKVSIALEELGLPYEAHSIDVSRGETRTSQFLTLNPNGKIPAIIDPDGPDGTPIALFESGAILLYLAEKTGKLLPPSAAERYKTIQWVFFQMSGVGPMFGQLGYFHKFAGREIDDKRPLERFRSEAQRLLGVLEQRLEDRGHLHHRRYFVDRLGSQPDHPDRRRPPRALRRAEERSGLAATLPGQGGSAARPQYSATALKARITRVRQFYSATRYLVRRVERLLLCRCRVGCPPCGGAGANAPVAESK
jgi:GST-like protein